MWNFFDFIVGFSDKIRTERGPPPENLKNFGGGLGGDKIFPKFRGGQARQGRDLERMTKNTYSGDKKSNILETHFFKKSGFVTFLHLSKSNLMQTRSQAK